MSKELEAIVLALSTVSLARVAELSGVSRQYLWEIRTGRADNPTIGTLADIMGALRALGVLV